MPLQLAGFDQGCCVTRIVAVHSIITLIALINPAAAWAESGTQNSSISERTLSTSSYVATTGGHVSGCGITFQYLTLDYLYKGGMPVQVNGSYDFDILPNYKTAWGLKLIVNDISDPFDNPKFTPSTPTNATMLDTNGYPIIEEKVTTFPGETPGSIIVVFKDNENMLKVIDRVAKKGELAFTFNRTQGGPDIPVSIDLHVKNDGAESDTITGFAQCMHHGLALLREHLGSRPK